jgi:hypothetical protein
LEGGGGGGGGGYRLRVVGVVGGMAAAEQSELGSHAGNGGGLEGKVVVFVPAVSDRSKVASCS